MAYAIGMSSKRQVARPQDKAAVEELLEIFPAVAILGARQVGKTTLARMVGADHVFDLENPRVLARFDNPLTTLEQLSGRIMIDEVQRVPELFAVESYPTVHHLVSTITGSLRGDEDAVSLLQACFPGGSVTGAPKHRAMEIIAELEPVPRSVYCGSIGWIGFDGNMGTNIAIRTLLLKDGVASYWAGGGIVADSEEEAEYQESLDKAKSFFNLADL